MTRFFKPEDEPSGIKKKVAIGVGVLTGLVLLGVVVNSFLGEAESSRKKVVHQISVLKPPPPPPPPKPPEQKPPEMKKEEVKIDEPPPQPDPGDDKPLAENLGVDAEGTAGADGFGLEGRAGGRDITTVGTGSSRSLFGWYASMLQRELEELSSKSKKLQGRNYSATVKLWIGQSGQIQQYELVGSTGDAEIDGALKQMLAELPPLKEPPPKDMPQPVRMRVTSRG